MSSAKWYALQVYSGHENKVKLNIEKMVIQHNLEDKILQVKIPTYEEPEMKKGKKTITKKKIMPGYILVEMVLDPDLQFMITNLPSVSTFVGRKNPEPVTLEEIKNLFSDTGDMKSEEPKKPRLLFNIGETLKIVDGPFANFSGVVDEIFPDKGRLKVKVEIFGQPTRVDLDYLQVTKT
jgi:transcriptional antiterminator NusG